MSVLDQRRVRLLRYGLETNDTPREATESTTRPVTPPVTGLEDKEPLSPCGDRTRPRGPNGYLYGYLSCPWSGLFPPTLLEDHFT